MKSDKYFTIKDINLGPKQIQSLAKDQFEQKARMRSEYYQMKELVAKEGNKKLSELGSTAPKSIFQGASGSGPNISEDGLGKLCADFEKEIEMRFQEIDNPKSTEDQLQVWRDYEKKLGVSQDIEDDYNEIQRLKD